MQKMQPQRQKQATKTAANKAVKAKKKEDTDIDWYDTSSHLCWNGNSI